MNDLTQPRPTPSASAEPRFWLRFSVYTSLGFLWAGTILGVISNIYIYRVGPQQSFIGDHVSRGAWTVLISIVAAYTLVVSLYLLIRGYRAQYSVVAIMNIALGCVYVLAVSIQAIIIFSVSV